MEQQPSILYRDESLLVVSKPAGVLSEHNAKVKAPSITEILAGQGLLAKAVHRLDMEVTGCLLLALDEPTRAALEEAFRQRQVHKVYWALARGRLERDQGQIHFPLLEEGPSVRVSARGKSALTRYRVLARFARVTELELEPVTGRRNQLRVHLEHLGHPLVGERKYAQGKDDPLRAKRVALHARRIEFIHPRTGTRLAIEAPLAEDLLQLKMRAAE